jgi:hypothetical protein
MTSRGRRRNSTRRRARRNVDPSTIFGVAPALLGLIERLGWPGRGYSIVAG